MDAPAGESDERVVARYVQGDRQAFAELVTRYERRVYSLCLRVLGNHHDAEDATQEVFIAVAARSGEFRQEARFSTWLYRVAHNAAIDLARKRGRHLTLSIDAPEAGGDAAVSVRGPDEAVTAAVAIEQALAALPLDFRAAVVLCDLLDLPYDEAARVLDVPVGTVKSRVHRGRAGLAQQLGTAHAGAASEPSGPATPDLTTERND